MRNKTMPCDVLVGAEAHGGRSSANCEKFFYLRVSMSAAYGASFDDAKTALAAILQMNSHRFLTDATQAGSLPPLSTGREVTDAHLVRLAANHGLKLATLDEKLAKKPWAAGIAENPLRRSREEPWRDFAKKN